MRDRPDTDSVPLSLSRTGEGSRGKGHAVKAASATGTPSREPRQALAGGSPFRIRAVRAHLTWTPGARRAGKTRTRLTKGLSIPTPAALPSGAKMSKQAARATRQRPADQAILSGDHRIGRKETGRAGERRKPRKLSLRRQAASYPALFTRGETPRSYRVENDLLDLGPYCRIFVHLRVSHPEELLVPGHERQVDLLSPVVEEKVPDDGGPRRILGADDRLPPDQQAFFLVEVRRGRDIGRDGLVVPGLEPPEEPEHKALALRQRRRRDEVLVLLAREG